MDLEGEDRLVFHLFHKTYLEFDFAFTSIYPSFLASDAYIKDPFIDGLGIDGPIRKGENLNDFLCKRFDEDIEKLWEHLFEQKSKNRFYIYLCAEDYHSIQLQYWKSVLAEPCFDVCYFLHKTHMQDLKLKAIFLEDMKNEAKLGYKEYINVLSEEKYKKVFSDVEASSYLKSLKPTSFSYEYFLADYLSKENQTASKAFLEKLECISWKLLVSELEILKSDIINGLFDFIKHYNNWSGNRLDFKKEMGSFLHIIKSNPDFTWMIDEDIKSEGLDYIRENYKYEKFISFFKLQYQINNEEINNENYDSFFVKIFKLIYNNDYIKLLKGDIEKGFGSAFFNNALRHKVNVLLVSYLYDSFKEGKFTEVMSYRIRNNNV